MEILSSIVRIAGENFASGMNGQGVRSGVLTAGRSGLSAKRRKNMTRRQPDRPAGGPVVFFGDIERRSSFPPSSRWSPSSVSSAS